MNTRSDFQVYSYFRSSASYRVRIGLELKGLPYQIQPVHLLKGGGEQNQASYRTLNPMGHVPFLVHDGMGLSQSMAILRYLDRIAPQSSPLFPFDPQLEARALEIGEIINSGIQPLQNLSVLQYLEKNFGASEEQRQDFARHWIRRGLTAVERLLLPFAGLGPFSLGAQVSVADAFVVPQHFGSLRLKVDMAPYPRLQAVVDHCLKLEAFKKAHPAQQPDYEG